MEREPSTTIAADLTVGSEQPFAFRVEPTLEHLIAHWQKAATGPDPIRAVLARSIGDALDRAPDLRGSLEDPAAVARHRQLVDLLMSAVIPEATADEELVAALIPYRLRTLYATPAFERLLTNGQGALRGRLNVDEVAALRFRVLVAYTDILCRFYGLEVNFDFPLIATTTDPDSGLERHFKLFFDSRFASVEPVGDLPALDAATRERILANPLDLALLTEVLPPERFVVRGFVICRAAEATEGVILSLLKRDLIDRESIVTAARFSQLQERLRALFRRPELELGVSAVDGEQVFFLNSSYHLEHGCIFADSKHYRVTDFTGSVFERAVLRGEPLFIHDLATYPEAGPHERDLIAQGARSIVIAPLIYQDALIGVLHISSPRPGDLSPAQAFLLNEVLPVFSMAVRRALDDLNARVQATIKEHCTAIHPSVEWRFRQAVLRGLDRMTSDGQPEIEPIVFEGVYPLYGATDIRGSSTMRNAAIQADLATHLELARDVLRAAHHARDLPILDALAWEVGRRREQLALGLNAGDELAILGFLRQRVEPVFDHIASLGAQVPARLEAYRSALDPRLGTVHQRRKAFDESVTLVNEVVSAYLEGEEQRAQAMYPHYFERQRTDGVDFGIYVGASLVEGGRFDPLYLRNLRLWQLMVMCGIARRAEALKGDLPVPLDTTHLILAHHVPLDIRFRFDEKRFDVDGAYNVRYEVIKKRIDKATIKGTAERITQPGRIAIVHSQPREAHEWREYIEYLQAREILAPGVEELELDQLQGVDGLRALRVTVNLAGPGADTGTVLDRGMRDDARSHTHGGASAAPPWAPSKTGLRRRSRRSNESLSQLAARLARAGTFLYGRSGPAAASPPCIDSHPKGELA
ncbi:MAG: GAF domain-containing protein [Candidatus Rokubacteria bacterium]|nr:GAF domain-containing protein [Candidatus Rokubacteria bacterium]